MRRDELSVHSPTCERRVSTLPHARVAQNMLTEMRKVWPLWHEYLQKGKIIHARGNTVFCHSMPTVDNESHLPYTSFTSIHDNVIFTEKERHETLSAFIQNMNKNYKDLYNKVFHTSGDLLASSTALDRRTLMFLGGPKNSGMCNVKGPFFHISLVVTRRGGFASSEVIA